MATARTTLHRLHVAPVLQTFIDSKVLPGTGISPAHFWQGFDALVADLAPKNIALLAERELEIDLDAIFDLEDVTRHCAEIVSRLDSISA